jgi:hypothetical protein
VPEAPSGYRTSLAVMRKHARTRGVLGALKTLRWLLTVIPRLTHIWSLCSMCVDVRYAYRFRNGPRRIGVVCGRFL